MALSTKEKQAAYRDRMRAAGLMPVQEWIPPESAELVRGICKRLREGKKAKRTTTG